MRALTTSDSQVDFGAPRMVIGDGIRVLDIGLHSFDLNVFADRPGQLSWLILQPGALTAFTPGSTLFHPSPLHCPGTAPYTRTSVGMCTLGCVCPHDASGWQLPVVLCISAARQSETTQCLLPTPPHPQRIIPISTAACRSSVCCPVLITIVVVLPEPTAFCMATSSDDGDEDLAQEPAYSGDDDLRCMPFFKGDLDYRRVVKREQRVRDRLQMCSDCSPSDCGLSYTAHTHYPDCGSTVLSPRCPRHPRGWAGPAQCSSWSSGEVGYAALQFQRQSFPTNLFMGQGCWGFRAVAGGVSALEEMQEGPLAQARVKVCPLIQLCSCVRKLSPALLPCCPGSGHSASSVGSPGVRTNTVDCRRP